MARVAAFSLVALLAAGAFADDRVDALIQKLGDPEPAARSDAFTQLKALTQQPSAAQRVVPALRRAVRDPQPNIADSAAKLLLDGRWWTAADPTSYRKIVMGYGQLPPTERANRVKRLIADRIENFPKLTIRVLMQDPADEVGWRALQDVDGDAEWEKALCAQPVENLTPALQLQLAKSKERTGDHDAAAALARRVLDSVKDDPNIPADALAFAAGVVVAAESESGRYDKAAEYLREQFASTGVAGQSEVLDQLLNLHIRFGPLPGLADDIKRSDTQGEPHGTIALALMADRVGLPLVGSALLGAAVADKPDEAGPDRAARLADIADWLGPKGRDTGACTPLDDAAARVYEKVTTGDETTLKNRIMLAYIRLSELHFRAGRMQLAGDALQRAIERQDGPLVWQRRNGRVDAWPIEDEQARVSWYYLMDARAREDKEAIKKHTQALVASGSTDSTIFLEALPSLEEVATPVEIDTYFDRVFRKAESRVVENPAEPVLLNDIAWLCARSGRQLEKAVEWAERAVKLVPEPAYLDTLAEAKFRTGKIKEAIDLETRALATQPEDETFMRQQLERFKQAATTRPND